MLLTDFKDTKASISQRLTKKKIFDVSGTLLVPAGVNKIYYTGVAAGARSGDAALNPVAGWSGSVAIGVSQEEGVCFATNNVGVVTDAPRIDPAGRKVSKINNTPIAANAGGNECFSADNGFVVTNGSGGIAISYTKDGGLNWLTTSQLKLSGNNVMALMPVSKEASAQSNRCAFLSNTANEVVVWNGAAWVASTYAGKSFTSMSYAANNYFIAAENNVTNKTSLYYKTATDAALASGWSTVVVDAVNQIALFDVQYGSGIYVAVGASGSIYTATNIAGPWTARTSNTTQQINGVKYAGVRWVAVCGDGDILTATDPTAAWTKTAAVGGAVNRMRKDLQYLPATGHWCVGVFSTAVVPKYSTDGATWTDSPASISVNSIVATSAGLLAANASGAMYVIPDPSKAASITLSTSGDGGDCRVVRGSTGAELLRLAGGKVGAVNLGGDGSSSTGVVIKGGQGSTQDKMAMGPRGAGIFVSATILGGGTCPFVEDLLLNDGMAGIKIPGGGGAYWTTSVFSGGGGSIMAAANAGIIPGQGPGGGMPSSTAGAGGGGEGVVRFPIDVTPGEILAVGNGLAQTSTGSVNNPQHGFGMIEWEG